VSGRATPGPKPLPRPPALLPRITPLQWQGSLWRIANEQVLTYATYPAPRYRFDAPGEQYPALYMCALDIGTFAETYVERGRRLGTAEGQRHLLEAHPKAPLPIVDLHDDQVLVALNLDERISVGDDYSTCQEWALAFHAQYPDICGIRYRARKAGALVANIFLYADRCASVLEVVAAPRLEEIPDVVLRAADRYRLTVYFPFKQPPP